MMTAHQDSHHLGVGTCLGFLECTTSYLIWMQVRERCPPIILHPSCFCHTHMTYCNTHTHTHTHTRLSGTVVQHCHHVRAACPLLHSLVHQPTITLCIATHMFASMDTTRARWSCTPPTPRRTWTLLQSSSHTSSDCTAVGVNCGWNLHRAVFALMGRQVQNTTSAASNFGSATGGSKQVRGQCLTSMRLAASKCKGSNTRQGGGRNMFTER
jgi:hypothetical protein